jgi:hypothetical protein
MSDAFRVTGNDDRIREVREQSPEFRLKETHSARFFTEGDHR